ncbi:MAG: DNA methyltransferase [Bacteroidia bacterium]
MKKQATKELKNNLYYGDNLEVLRKYIKDDSIDLCYIDPPFNSKRNYNQIYNNIGSEDKALARAFVDTWTWDDYAIYGFTEITTNEKNRFSKQTIQLIFGLEKVLGKGSLLAYVISMTLRIVEIHRVLKPTGSFYLHCDPTASHYLKLVIDSIFCSKKGQFQNEIVWHYRRWTGKADKFQELHDVIFYYTKSDEYTFNVQYTPYTEGSKSRKEQGVLHRFKKGEDPYLVSDGEVDERGVRDNDVWQIPFIAPSAKERLGYPTQKPEALLEKVIKASSNKGDIVLDAYCGCGTTVAVAEKLGRKWIGIDITYQSISLILRRLKKAYEKKIIDRIELNGVPKDMESAIALANKKEDKTRKEFEKWSVLTYSDDRAIINEKKGADGGIDGIAFINDYEDNGVVCIKEILFSVKSDKKPHVSYIRDLNGAMQRENAAMGYFITLYPPTKDMLEEAKKLGKYKNKMFGKDYDRIKIVTVEQILKGELFDVPKTQEIAVVKSAKLKENDKGQEKLNLD